ncbi:hypothetical protein CMV_027168, partial [Castanea mollissima]
MRQFGFCDQLVRETVKELLEVYGNDGRYLTPFLKNKKLVSKGRWENPLMGWTSTGDPYANVGDAAMSFDSEEAAKSFAERHGWDYVVKKRHTPLLK